MKKNTALMATVVLTALYFGGSQVHAAETEPSATVSKGTSENKINFIAGEDIITPPVDPTDPEKPVDPEKPIDPTDPENPGTGEEGPLSIDYISNLKFGEHQISGKNIAYKALNQNPFVQVTDVRGAGDGWSLSAKMTEFTNDDKVLKGATLSMKDSVVKAGSTSNISAPPVKSDVVFTNQESQLIMNAKDKAGRGTWLNVWSGTDQANEAIQLNVIAGTPEVDTEYTSSITWELEDAPK